MGLETLAYPFLLLAIFFESFILVTFLSKPARAARARASFSGEHPSAAVIIPCWNEAETVAETCRSALALDYPKNLLEVILVDDGSTDATPAAMSAFSNHPQVKIIRKENGGKHTALNAGIDATRAEIVGCLDADSFVEPDALNEIISCFTANERVAAVTAAMSVHKPKTILQHMQHAEYIFGITLRHVLASVNGLYVTPGPFSFYRRAVVEKLGGFRYGHQTEDMEMALRIQQAGSEIDNAPRARVYTKAPATLPKLVKQRTRWTSGFLRNILGEYRSLIWNQKNSSLGMLVLPTSLIAVGSSILLFMTMLFMLGKRIVDAVQVRMGIPLSYVVSMHKSFDWFYVPTSLYLFLGIIVLSISLTLILIGKWVSKTPGNLIVGVFSYAFLYGLIVPLWLIRATSDVALGKRRNWRY